MEVVNKQNKETKTAPNGVEEKTKLTYEQLNDACNQLWQQNQRLMKRNTELEQFGMFKRLDYLFKVLEHSEKFPSDFVIICTDEIKDAMTITPSENREGESKEGKVE